MQRVKHVFAFDSQRLGTSSLRKHVECCESSTGVTIERFFALGHKRPRREDKEAKPQWAVKSVNRDIQSFETVSGVGFLEMAHWLYRHWSVGR